MYTITAFKNQYDTSTTKFVEYPDWSMVEQLLYGMSRMPGQKGGKNSSPLISPAKYLPGSTRCNASVHSWDGWCAVDVDTFVIQCNSNVELRNKIEELVGDYYFLCYSTASSTIEHPKFRLVFPLQAPVMAEDIKHFWFALNNEIGSQVDKQTKDLSRMFYVPAQYPNAYNFFFRHKGPVMDPDVLMDKWPYTEPTGNTFMDRLPEEVRNQIIKYKKSKLLNTNVTWSSYSNCPFWPKSLESEYRSITQSGWYLTMYKIMVAIASKAIKAGYPITAYEIARLCKEFDQVTGNWYEKRPLDKEADRALEYVFKHSKI